jgi:hypothetical protein
MGQLTKFGLNNKIENRAVVNSEPQVFEQLTPSIVEHIRLGRGTVDEEHTSEVGTGLLPA